MEEGYDDEQEDNSTIRNISLLFLFVIVTGFFGVISNYDLPSFLGFLATEIVIGICCQGIKKDQKSDSYP